MNMHQNNSCLRTARVWKRIVSLCGVWCLAMGSLQAQGLEEDLRVAHQAYEDGVLEVVRTRLGELQYTTHLDDPLVQEGLLLLAFTAYRENQVSLSELYLDRLLIADPLKLELYDLYLLKLNILFAKEDFFLAEKTVDLIWQLDVSRTLKYQSLDMLLTAYFDRSTYNLARHYLDEKLKKTTDEIDHSKYQLSILETLLRQDELGEAHSLLKSVELGTETLESIREQADLLSGRFTLGSHDYQSGSRQYLEMFEDMTLSNVGRQEALFGLCLSYWNLGQYDKAEEYFETYLENYPLAKNLGDAQLMLGQVYLKLERYDAAEGLLKELTDKPLEEAIYAKSLYWLGEAHYRQKNYDSANDIYEQLLGMAELDALNELYGLFGLAWVFYDQEEAAHARDYFLKVKAMELDHAFVQEAWVMAANCHYLLAEYVEARELYTTYLARHSLSRRADEVRLKLGFVQAKLGQVEAAVDTWLVLAEERPNSDYCEEAYWRAGKLLYEKGAYERAHQAFALLTTFFPEGNFSDYAFLELGNCLYNLTRYQEALEAYRLTSAKAKLPEVRSRALYYMGWCHFLNKDEAQALNIFQTLLEQDPDSELAPQIQFWLGEYEYNRYHFDRARKAFGAFFERFPGSDLMDNCLYLAAKSSYRLSDFKDAVQLLSELQDKYPESDLVPDAVYLKGEALFQQKEYRASAEELIVFDTAFEESYLRKEAFTRLGDAYFNLEEYNNARIYFEKADKMGQANLEQRDLQLVFRQAECYAALKETEKALELGLSVIYDAPDNAWMERGINFCVPLYEVREEYEKAINLLAKLLKEGEPSSASDVKRRIRKLKYYQIHRKDAA